MWLVFLLVMVLAVWGIRRRLVRERARQGLRREGMLEVVEAFGFVGSASARPPSDLPAWYLTRGGGVPKVMVVADRGQDQIAVFDHTMARAGPLGYNSESRNSDDHGDGFSRHTCVCLKSPRLSVGSFDLVPNAREFFDRGLAPHLEETRSQVASQDRLGGLVGRLGTDLVVGMAQMALAKIERKGAVRVEGWEELEKAFLLYCDDVDSVRATLTPSIRDQLARSPGLILEARGDWLLLSRHIRLSGLEPSSDLDFGYLALEDVRRLVEEVLDLFRAFSRVEHANLD